MNYKEQLVSAVNIQSRMFNLLDTYLGPLGWLEKEPKKEDGTPLPWFTYPAISFLEDIITPEMKVFEYGAGYSTLYFNATVTECNSVEHDKKWIEKLYERNDKVNVKHLEQWSAYDPAIKAYVDDFKALKFNHPRTTSFEHDMYHGLINENFDAYACEVFSKPVGYYDIIVVDGMARSMCAYMASKAVKDDGFIIFDNAERHYYNDVEQYLVDQGFGRVDFWGTGPTNSWGWTTSMFSKNFRIKNNKVARPVIEGPTR